MSKSCFTCVHHRVELVLIPVATKDEPRKVPCHRCNRDIVPRQIAVEEVDLEGNVSRFTRRIEHPFTTKDEQGYGPVLTCREMLLNGCRDYFLYEYDKRMG